MKTLVSTNWLEKNLYKVKILDASWHLPTAKRQAKKEFKLKHISNSIFFDIDENSNKKTSLPHMLSNISDWEKIVSSLGIKNSDHIVIYDSSELLSSCRVWYNFLYFNHNPNLVSVLDGGLKKWEQEGKSTTSKIINFEKSNYQAKENKDLVLNKSQIEANIKNKFFELVDARSKKRFLGEVPEARPGLTSGNIKGSKNLPFSELISATNNTFKSKSDLIRIFKKHDIETSKNLAFTCGSGITACVLGLANSIISDKKPVIYDGSWSEYGLKK